MRSSTRQSWGFSFFHFAHANQRQTNAAVFPFDAFSGFANTGTVLDQYYSGGSSPKKSENLVSRFMIDTEQFLMRADAGGTCGTGHDTAGKGLQRDQ